MSIKDWNDSLKPREKALNQGLDKLSDAELLALILKTGNKGEDAITFSNRLLNEVGGLAKLISCSLSQLMAIKGLGLAKGCELLSCLEIVKRINYDLCRKDNVVSNPTSLINWLKSYIGNKNQEYFIAVYLNNKNYILGFRQLFIGSDNCVSVKPKEIFIEALKQDGCTGIIVAHNHPSQSAKPSRADSETTYQLIEAGKMLHLPILDHIVVSFNDYYSYREHNYPF